MAGMKTLPSEYQTRSFTQASLVKDLSAEERIRRRDAGRVFAVPFNHADIIHGLPAEFGAEPASLGIEMTRGAARARDERKAWYGAGRRRQREKDNR